MNSNNKVIRVLQFVPTLQAHGVENYAINFYRQMNGEDLVIDFCVLHDKSIGYYEQYLLAQGSCVYKINHSISSFKKFCREIENLFKDRKYDVAHINCGSSVWYIIAKIAKQCGVGRVIYHSHNTSNITRLKRFAHKLFRTKLNKYCDVHLACSNAAGKHMFNKNDFTVLNNAISLEKFSYSEEHRLAIREQFGIQDKLLIGHVGRFNSQKNQIFLLKAVKNLKRLLDEFCVMFIGDGEDIDKLKKYTDDNDLSENVIFIDNVGADIYKYYNAFDILAFPSLYEGLSVVLIEAQANGLPIIASDRISPEHKIANNYFTLSIEGETSAKKWAQEICAIDKHRADNTYLMKVAGYDITTESLKLKKIYFCEDNE